MKIKITLILIGILCLGIGKIQGQDIHFSQPQQLPLFYNPALTGAFGGEVRLSTTYRSQWAKVPVPYQTFAAAVDTKLQSRQVTNFLGLGLNVFSDRAGDLQFRTSGLQFAFAYQMLVGRADRRKGDFYARLGFRAGMVSQSFDQHHLRLEDPMAENPLEEKNQYSDYALGLLGVYVEPKFFLYWGGSLSHFGQPFLSFFEGQQKKIGNGEFLFQKINAQIGGDFTLGNLSTNILPELYFTQQGSSREWLMGMAFRFDQSISWQFGTFYRWKDAIILTSRWQLSQNIELSFSYDFSVSTVSRANRRYGAMEFNGTYTFHSPRTQLAPSQSGGIRKSTKTKSNRGRAYYKNVSYKKRGLAR